MADENRPPVVISRKDKKLGAGHGAALILTGGVSGIYTAGRAAANAGYNARTRELQRGGSSQRPTGRVQPPPPPRVAASHTRGAGRPAD